QGDGFVSVRSLLRLAETTCSDTSDGELHQTCPERSSISRGERTASSVASLRRIVQRSPVSNSQRTPAPVRTSVPLGQRKRPTSLVTDHSVCPGCRTSMLPVLTVSRASDGSGGEATDCGVTNVSGCRSC